MKFWCRLAIWASCALAFAAQAADPEASKPPVNSGLSGTLFYQLLLGELNVRQGAPGAGFSLLLDAARKTRDPALFQRAIDVALQSRSGEAALQAAQTWKRELPEAQEPNRYTLQILLALNRIEDAGQALAVSLGDLPESEKAGAIVSIPRVFAQVHDKTLAAQVVEKALAHALTQSPLKAAAWTTIGRMRRDAELWPQAVDAALQAHAADPKAQGPLVLGLSLLPKMGTPPNALKTMLDGAMRGQVSPELRLGYARSLIALQATEDALRQLGQLTQLHPTEAPGWLLQGLLQLESGRTDLARESLSRHVDLVKNSTDPEQQAGLTEALLALSQLAQRQGQLEQANRWLAQIPASADPLRVAVQRAELLDQQGRSEEARLVLKQVPTADEEQARRKTLALSRWLREHRQAQQAYELLTPALQTAPQDHDLLTELSLVTEKLQRHEEMEKVLRELMRMRPQDPHAYNALGYSLAERGVRLEEARELIQRALTLTPQDPYIQDSLGWVEFRLGRHDEALRILQTAYKSRPDAEIAAHIGEVLWALQRKDEALAIWREGLLLKSDNETLTNTLRRLGAKP